MNPNNMQDLVRNMARMRKDMEKVGDDLKDRYVEAEAGGGKVEVVFNGQQEMVKVSLDPSFVKSCAESDADIELLEDMILAAVSQGVQKSKALMREELDSVSGGLGGALPGFF